MAEDQDLRVLREAAVKGDVLWHHHALERILERDISRAEVLVAIAQGEVVERYAESRPFPSYLIMRIKQQPLHVVAAVDSASMQCHIVTVYRPDAERFEADFKTRRRNP